jgi:hypothetical protein
MLQAAIAVWLVLAAWVSTHAGVAQTTPPSSLEGDPRLLRGGFIDGHLMRSCGGHLRIASVVFGESSFVPPAPSADHLDAETENTIEHGSMDDSTSMHDGWDGSGPFFDGAAVTETRRGKRGWQVLRNLPLPGMPRVHSLSRTLGLLPDFPAPGQPVSLRHVALWMSAHSGATSRSVAEGLLRGADLGVVDISSFGASRVPLILEGMADTSVYAVSRTNGRILLVMSPAPLPPKPDDAVAAVDYAHGQGVGGEGIEGLQRIDIEFSVYVAPTSWTATEDMRVYARTDQKTWLIYTLSPSLNDRIPDRWTHVRRPLRLQGESPKLVQVLFEFQLPDYQHLLLLDGVRYRAYYCAAALPPLWSEQAAQTEQT